MRGSFAGARLAMRPLEAGDAEALHEAYGDAALMRWWSTPPHASVEETRDYLVGEDDDDSDEDEWHAWAVTLDGTPIGTVSAGPRRQGVWEIGYILVRRYWGQGYGREMVARLVELLIEDESARRIYADVDPDNAASIALLEGLGFRLEGRLRAAWESHIGIRDALIFGLLREEWRGPAARSDPAIAEARATAMLVRPIRLMGLVLALFGLGLAVAPRVPKAVTGVVLALALVQLAIAMILRRRAT